MSPSCLAWPRAPYQARWLGGYSLVVNVLSHDRHLTPLCPCRHGDASGVTYPKDDRPFSVGYGLPRTHLPRLWVNKALCKRFDPFAKRAFQHASASPPLVSTSPWLRRATCQHFSFLFRGGLPASYRAQ